MKAWIAVLGISIGFAFGLLIMAIGAPAWACSIGSGLASGTATHFLLKKYGR